MKTRVKNESVYLKNNNKHLELRNDDFKRRHLKDAEIRVQGWKRWLIGLRDSSRLHYRPLTES